MARVTITLMAAITIRIIHGTIIITLIAVAIPIIFTAIQRLQVMHILNRGYLTYQRIPQIIPGQEPTMA